MKTYTYDEALKEPGVYKTLHFPENFDPDFESPVFGNYDFHSDGETLIPFYLHEKMSDERHIWVSEIFAKIAWREIIFRLSLGMKESFCIRIRNKGVISYLSVNGKTNWKDLKTAKKHARDLIGEYDEIVIETNESGAFVLELAWQGLFNRVLSKYMKLYHVTNGKAYWAGREMNLEQYKEYVRKAYGSLRGVKFVYANDLNEALHKAVNKEIV